MKEWKKEKGEKSGPLQKQEEEEEEEEKKEKKGRGNNIWENLRH